MGELFFSHRSHDPLGCSFKAELRALLCCLKVMVYNNGIYLLFNHTWMCQEVWING